MASVPSVKNTFIHMPAEEVADQEHTRRGSSAPPPNLHPRQPESVEARPSMSTPLATSGSDTGDEPEADPSSTDLAKASTRSTSTESPPPSPATSVLRQASTRSTSTESPPPSPATSVLRQASTSSTSPESLPPPSLLASALGQASTSSAGPGSWPPSPMAAALPQAVPAPGTSAASETTLGAPSPARSGGGGCDVGPRKGSRWRSHRQPAASRAPAEKSQQLCKHFAKGNCNVGNRCKFSHSGEQAFAAGAHEAQHQNDERHQKKVAAVAREFFEIRQAADFEVLEGSRQGLMAMTTIILAVSDHGKDYTLKLGEEVVQIFLKKLYKSYDRDSTSVMKCLHEAIKRAKEQQEKVLKVWQEGESSERLAIAKAVYSRFDFSRGIRPNDNGLANKPPVMLGDRPDTPAKNDRLPCKLGDVWPDAIRTKGLGKSPWSGIADKFCWYVAVVQLMDYWALANVGEDGFPVRGKANKFHNEYLIEKANEYLIEKAHGPYQ